MRCLTPITMTRRGQDLTIPCGQCHGCRIRKRELWAGRILLESFSHPHNWFVTLTYSPEHLPECGSVEKRDAQLFLKRLRKRVSPEKIRYFCVGEYGSRTERPHYHFVLYTRLPDISDAVDASWARGFTTCAELTPERARYCARYTTKKLTGPMSFADGRSPEFATMSRRPGLGREQALKIGRALTRCDGSDSAIPTYVKLGGKRIQLDAYTREIVRNELYGEAQQEILKEISLYQAHEKSPRIRAEVQENAQAISEALKLADSARAKARDAI